MVYRTRRTRTAVFKLAFDKLVIRELSCAASPGERGDCPSRGEAD